MMILVTYDINTETKEGRKRLGKVAKICVNYGQRVQNSVFELNISPDQYLILKKELNDTIDHRLDSLRFYRLGKNYQNRIELMGKNESYDPENDSLII